MPKEETPFEAGTRRDEATAEKLSFMRRPLWRGVMNGVALAGLILVFRSYGILQPAQPLTQNDYVEAAVAGAFFTVIMYFWTMWTNKRLETRLAADAARRQAQADAEAAAEEETNDTQDRR
jgi:amino acid permease